MKYTAKFDTWLKKSPVEASTLKDDEKVLVKKGYTYSVNEVLDTEGLHSQIELDYGAGSWWLFLPHWDLTGGEVTAHFSLKQAKSPSLIYGYLTFKENNKEILKVRATSGLARYQYKGAETIRARGCIPPDEWKINTQGYYSSTRGIQGMFYHITPDPHPSTGRGEFGLHRDANVPGSAGCVVVKTADFRQKVRPLIDGIRDKQKYIKLTVTYE